jgi:hypothetical protein
MDKWINRQTERKEERTRRERETEGQKEREMLFRSGIQRTVAAVHD